MRLDAYLLEIKLFNSRTKAKQAIERGEIYINDKQILKSSYEIDENKPCKVKRQFVDDFVSLGGFKLKKALEDFDFNVNDFICADIGASTGGFTDCLIKNGAKKIYAIDLNDNLLHDTLKSNNKVISIIKNVKDLTKKDFNDNLDLIVADLSFISITQALPVISNLLLDGKFLIALIKPQFETGEKKRFKNGIIKDKKIQIKTCENVYNCALENLLNPVKFTTAPINENKNIEFLMMFVKNGQTELDINFLNF